MRSSFKRIAFSGLLLLSQLSMAAQSGENATLEIAAGRSQIIFDVARATPISWIVCESDCADARARWLALIEPDDGAVHILTSRANDQPFIAETAQTEDAVEVRFRSGDEVRLFSLAKSTAVLNVELPPGAQYSMATGSSFIPEALPGIGAVYSRVQLAKVSADGQQIISFGELESGKFEEELAAGSWAGIRNRYWAWLVSPQSSQLTATLGYTKEDRPALTFESDDSTQPVVLQLYAGPVEWRELRQVSPALSEMLFAALWDFLRWLCFGMLLLFDFIYGVVGNYGIAIVLLSLAAKVLMLPLTKLADRWQAEVNKINSVLQPEIAAIKKAYKGEDAHRKTLAVFKKHNISQWYTFKSAAGFLIQIPVFIAAFDMLAENFALNQQSFLWITDLAKPDQFAHLPFTLPFFGTWLNLLPFLMSGLSLLAAWMQQEDTLTSDLQKQQSTRLYVMAAAFFVLFYTFPAGMVLYWTASNLFHLLKVELMPLLRKIGKGSS